MRLNKLSIAGTVCLGLSLALLAYLVRSPYEITRLRNSMLASVGEMPDFNWTPSRVPEAYSAETVAPPPDIQSALSGAGVANSGETDWQRALAIARHMTGGDRTTSKPIQSNTLAAYRSIVEGNNGYCSDYTQVFNGLGLTLDVPVREWGVSFDGFSGKGHAFSEIYDREDGTWKFLDAFYSFYVVDRETQAPLSVLEFRKRLANRAAWPSMRVLAIDPGAFAFKSEEHALEYYARGVDQFYLWYANDVFSYDGNRLIGLVAGLGRSVEQAVAIAIGAHPTFRIVPTDGNAQWTRRLDAARQTFGASFVLGVVGVGLLAVAWLRRRRAV